MSEEVEMIPVAGAEPPKANPLATSSTARLTPVARPEAVAKPAVVTPTVAKPATAPAASPLRPGLKLPPKTGATVSMMRPGLKLPTQSALKPGLKLPPKPGATVTALRPGLKLPTQTALKPGVRLPQKPVIRKPGTAAAAVAPLPKPVAPSAAPVAQKPLAVDAQGVGKLPTVSAPSVSRDDVAPVVSDLPNPIEALKAATQKLKGITQEIPQQAILHKTGIISEGALAEAQKEAAKHKTARISLADAMGVAPVKDDAAPMKTIRIRRPIDIPTPTTLTPGVSSAGAAPVSKPVAPTAAAPSVTPAAPKAADAVPELKPEGTTAPAATSTAPATSVTQRRTIKVARPTSGAVRPTGKFTVKRPAGATTVSKAPAAGSAATPGAAAPASGDNSAVADIPDIPSMPAARVPMAAAASDGPSWAWTLSAIVQLAACAVIGALAWFLYQNTQTAYF